MNDHRKNCHALFGRYGPGVNLKLEGMKDVLRHLMPEPFTESGLLAAISETDNLWALSHILVDWNDVTISALTPLVRFAIKERLASRFDQKAVAAMKRRASGEDTK